MSDNVEVVRLVQEKAGPIASYVIEAASGVRNRKTGVVGELCDLHVDIYNTHVETTWVQQAANEDGERMVTGSALIEPHRIAVSVESHRNDFQWTARFDRSLEK